jgi:hypothetical protein
MGFTAKQMLEKATEFVPFSDLDLYIKPRMFRGERLWVVETEIGERISSSLEEIPNDPSIKASYAGVTMFKTVEQAFSVAEAYRMRKLEV